jgi:hypothetical protein
MVKPPVAAAANVNVLTLALTLFFLYVILTALASFALALGAQALHPATRLFIWFVVAASTGWGLLRRHRRVPPRSQLWTALALAIATMALMSISLILKLAPERLATEALGMVVNSAALFAVGVAAFWSVEAVFRRRRGVAP